MSTFSELCTWQWRNELGETFEENVSVESGEYIIHEDSDARLAKWKNKVSRMSSIPR